MLIQVVRNELYIPPRKRLILPPHSVFIPPPPQIVVSIGGVVSVREPRYRRVIGHPDMAGATYRVGDVLYVGFHEAIKRQRDGERNVEIHWTSEPEDEIALASIRKEVRLNYRRDPLSKLDGWTLVETD